MARALFRCGGAAVPKRWESRAWDVRDPINHVGPAANVNLKIENLSHALLSQVSARAADLVRIASYVYAADQSVRRGKMDVDGDAWRRDMALAISVNDPDYWNQTDVKALLSATLHFLSEDSWEFEFYPAKEEERQLVLSAGPGELHGEADSVVLFSGGMDSLCAALEAVRDGAKPVIVSHRPSPDVKVRQRDLVNDLRERFRQWEFPHISFRVHRRGDEAKERTQRTRSFLFSSLGTAAAKELGLTKVVLADNGVASIHLPVNNQLIGALATRSTHPKFIASFNALIANAFDGSVKVINPQWSRTRRQVLDVLKEVHAEDLLPKTLSCANRTRLRKETPQCGVCSQCIDRRFATIGAGLEEYDPGHRYAVDIFRDGLSEGNHRTLVLSYVRFAQGINAADEDSMLVDYPQLADGVPPDDPDPDGTAKAIIQMYKRQSDGVLSVIAERIANASYNIAAGEVDPHCLVRLVAAGVEADTRVSDNGASQKTDRPVAAETSDDGAKAGEDDFRHAEDFRSVYAHGREYSLTPRQAEIVRILHGAYLNKTPDVSWSQIRRRFETISERLVDVFKDSEAWNNLVVAGKTRGTYRLNL